MLVNDGLLCPNLGPVPRFWRSETKNKNGPLIKKYHLFKLKIVSTSKIVIYPCNSFHNVEIESINKKLSDISLKMNL
jgi:hypothetical protein